MQLSNFDYHLPAELIAQNAAEPRDSARLLCLGKNSGEIEDRIFRDIEDMLEENDVLVVNETRVIKARLKGKILPKTQHLSPTLSCEEREQKKCSPFPLGGERIQDRGIKEGELKDCEIFLHKQISEDTWDCLVYPGKKLKVGTKVVLFSPQSGILSPSREKGATKNKLACSSSPLPQGRGLGGGQTMEGVITSISNKGRIVQFSKSGQEFLDIIDTIGETPLPPYIKDSQNPDKRYQTVYSDSEKSGSVAAPTAGLHFTPELLEKLQKKGVKIEKVCLHVGLGTFMNVEVDNITEHNMHSEEIFIEKETSERLNKYKSEGKRIIAVGTTSVRTLESFAEEDGKLGYGHSDTEIFIYPGYEWRFVDSIITNFHLPKSTLLMLVSSFAGDENRKKAYRHAVDSQYRFFSFGDAMWIY